MNIFENSLWIWEEKSQTKINQYCEFIHLINLNDIYESKFYISATKDYILYINGNMVSFGQWTDYPNMKSYDEIDITDYLQKGLNKIAILAYNPWTDFCSYIQDKAGIIYSLKTKNETFNSGIDTYYRISKVFRNGNIEKLSDQLNYTFEANLNNEDYWYKGLEIPNDFTKITHKDTYIKECYFFKRPIKKLFYEPKNGKIIISGQFIRKEEYSSAAKTCDRDFLGGNDLRIKINLPCNNLPNNNGYDVSSINQEEFPIENGYFIVDMEDTVAGHLHLDFFADKNCVLTCSYGEHLNDLRVRSHFVGHNFGFRIFAKEGQNNFDYRFTRLGGRYLEIHVSGKAIFKDARILNLSYPLNKPNRFISDNSLETKIADTCINTLKNCMHDHFEDTPWREQGLYTLDSRNQSLCNYYVYENFEYIRENIRLFVPTLTKEGHLKLTAPSNFYIPIPIFTYAWVMWLKDYIEYSQDINFAKEMYPVAKEIIENIVIDSNGLCLTFNGTDYWNFVEWNPGLIGDGENTGKYSLPHNAFAICAIDSYIYICQKLNIDCLFIFNLSKALKEANHKYFWCPEKKLYKTYIDSPFDPHFAQISNALALYAHIVPKNIEKIVRKQLVSNKDLIECTLSMCLYKYEALLQDKQYIKYVFEDIEKQWGNMLYNGATTFWETKLGSWYESHGDSLSHGWSSIPIYFYFKYKNNSNKLNKNSK